MPSWGTVAPQALRVVQGSLGGLVADSATHLHDMFAVGGEEALRVFEAMGIMSKLEIATLEAAGRG